MAAVASEASSSRIQLWLGEQAPGTLLISDWAITEVSSALSMKLRTRQFDLSARAAAAAAFNSLILDSLILLPVLTQHFRAAAAYADRHELGLRSGDALHLAVAVDQGATVHTLDVRLHQACLTLGVATVTA